MVTQGLSVVWRQQTLTGRVKYVVLLLEYLTLGRRMKTIYSTENTASVGRKENLRGKNHI